MIEQERAQAGELFAAASSSGAAMQATWNHIAVARVLGANGGIHSQDPSVKVAEAENGFLQESRIVGKNRGYQRAVSTANHRDKVLWAVVANQGYYGAEYFNVVNIF